MGKKSTKNAKKNEPLRAASVHTLPPGEADRQVAMYEAALRGDDAEFVRLRDAS